MTTLCAPAKSDLAQLGADVLETICGATRRDPAARPPNRFCTWNRGVFARRVFVYPVVPWCEPEQIIGQEVSISLPDLAAFVARLRERRRLGPIWVPLFRN